MNRLVFWSVSIRK